MKLKTLFIYNIVVAFPFGAGLVVAPVSILTLFGIKLNPGGAFVAQLFGSVLIFVALLCWFARNSEDSEARRAIVLASFLESILGCIIALIAKLSGLTNLLGWLIVALYFSMTVGYGYFWFEGQKSST